jgi:hypothetical protein
MLGQFLSQGLYANREGRVVIFNDASAVCLQQGEPFRATLYARVPHLAAHLQKVVPRALQEEGLVLLP